MNRPARQADQAQAHPWHPAYGGFDGETRRGYWRNWRRPLEYADIIAARALFVSIAIYSGIVFSLLPSSSLLCAVAKGALSGVAVSLIGMGPLKIGQLLGLRPPADRAGTRRADS